VLTSKAILDEIAATASLTFAPGLFDLLISQTAPTIAELKKLPTNVLPTRLSKIWGVYLLVLEKPDCRPRVYIGSSTNQAGIIQRLN